MLGDLGLSAPQGLYQARCSSFSLSSITLSIMSEYQYFEFQSLDRALTAAEQADLRKYSSRAKVGSRSFCVEYHYGDFKGDDMEWMERFFDAHVYLSSFGTRALHFRLPLGMVDREVLRPFEVKDVFEVHSTFSHVIFSFSHHDEPGRDYDEFDQDPAGVMSILLPVRDMLARGDLRPLYLAWLLGVQIGLVDEEELEPPVPPGLKSSDTALRDFADCLWWEKELTDVAAECSGDVTEVQTDAQIQPWIAGLSVAEKDQWLARLLSDHGSGAVQELRSAFMTSTRSHLKLLTKGQRTAFELTEAAEALGEKRRDEAARKAVEEEAAREKREKEARLVHLRSMDGRETQFWQSVMTLTDSSSQKSYDLAIGYLKDLRDLAALKGQPGVFSQKLTELRDLRRRKPSLIARLDQLVE